MRAIILDTTYVLPLFGIDVNLNEDFINKFEKLWDEGIPDYKLYLTSTSLMEVTYKLNKDYRINGNFEVLQRYAEILPLVNDSKIVSLLHPFTNINASAYFAKIRALGHKDLMDCWILASVPELDGIFLTEDTTLKKKIKKCDEPDLKKIPFWNWDKIEKLL